MRTRKRCNRHEIVIYCLNSRSFTLVLVLPTHVYIARRKLVLFASILRSLRPKAAPKLSPRFRTLYSHSLRSQLSATVSLIAFFWFFSFYSLIVVVRFYMTRPNCRCAMLQGFGFWCQIALEGFGNPQRCTSRKVKNSMRLDRYVLSFASIVSAMFDREYSNRLALSLSKRQEEGCAQLPEFLMTLSVLI